MYEYKAKVLRVVDGDTIDVMIDLGFKTFIKTRLRLYGINTPETRTRNKEEKKKGLRAKEFVKLQVENKEVKVEIFKKAGKYGRWLAYVHVKEDTPEGYYFCLNDKLIKEGLAKRYYGKKRS